MRSAVLGFAGLAALGVACGCGPATVRPTSYADPDVTCPAGRSAWSLEIKDERAEPKGSEKMVAAIRDGIQKSFPGCRWSTPPRERTRSRSRFTASLRPSTTSTRRGRPPWNGPSARTDAGGRTLTEFQADEEAGAAELPRLRQREGIADRGVPEGAQPDGQGTAGAARRHVPGTRARATVRMLIRRRGHEDTSRRRHLRRRVRVLRPGPGREQPGLPDRVDALGRVRGLDARQPPDAHAHVRGARARAAVRPLSLRQRARSRRTTSTSRASSASRRRARTSTSRTSRTSARRSRRSPPTPGGSRNASSRRPAASS